MSSTSPGPLSAHERLVLETMVHHECRHDPAFVERLTTWTEATADRGTHGRPRPRAAALVAALGVLLVLGVLVGLAAAGLVAFAAVGVVVLLVAPVVLVVRALRQAPH